MSAYDYTHGEGDNAYYYIDNVSLTPTAGPTFAANYTFTNASPYISGTFTNQNILISGNAILSANATFDHCQIRCNEGSTILVPYGKTFSIINETNFEAGCANRWEGIKIRGGNLVMRGSSIKDAYTAISFDSTVCTWQIYRRSEERR